MIETLYMVACSGPCRRYLACELGGWVPVADYMRDLFGSLDEAEQAGRDAGWIACGEHAGHLVLPGEQPACLQPVCPECRAVP